MNNKTTYKQKYEELEKGLFSNLADPTVWPWYAGTALAGAGALKYGPKALKAVKEMIHHFHQANGISTEQNVSETPQTDISSLVPKDKRTYTKGMMMNNKTTYKQKYEELNKNPIGFLLSSIGSQFVSGLQDPDKLAGFVATGMGLYGAHKLNQKYGPKALKRVKEMMDHFHQANGVSTEQNVSEDFSTGIPQKARYSKEFTDISSLIPKDKRTTTMKLPEKPVEKSFDMETMARLTGKSIERIQNDISHADFLGNSAFKEPERIANPQQGIAERMLVAEYTPPINNDLMNDNFIHQMSLISNLSHDEVIAKLSRAEFNGNPFYQGKKNV